MSEIRCKKCGDWLLLKEEKDVSMCMNCQTEPQPAPEGPLHIKEVLTRAVIVDIDGTIADGTHREHHLQNDPPDWDRYLSLMHLDTEHKDILDLVDLLYRTGHTILLCTSRGMEYEVETKNWLEDYKVPYHKLYMRTKGDRRQDTVIKAEIYREMLEYGYKIWFVLEDRERVVEMWRNLGVTCLQVRKEENFVEGEHTIKVK